MGKRTKKPKIIMRSAVAAGAKFGLGIAVALACLFAISISLKIAGATEGWWLIGSVLHLVFGKLIVWALGTLAVVGLLTVTFSFIVFGDWCPVTHQDFDSSNNKDQYPDSGGKPIPEK